MPPEHGEQALRAAISACLEAIIDPCSIAAGAPAGLVSMGLVGDVTIAPGPEGGTDGARLDVTLYVTEPGCIVGALFQLTAQRELAKLTGVASVEVHVDHGHFWDQTQMTPAYRGRLAEFRACQTAHMTSLRQATQQTKGRLSR